MKLYKQIFKDLGKDKFFLFSSIILAIIYVVASLYLPILAGDCVDLIVEKGNVNFEKIFQIFIIMGLLLVIAAIAQYLLNLCNNHLIYKYAASLRKRTFEKLERLPLKYLDSHPSGDILSRLSSDIEVVNDGLLIGMNQLFIGVFTIVMTLVFMFILNYIMAIVVVVLTPLSLFAARFIAKNINRYFYQQASYRGEQIAFIEEMMNNQKVVRAFNYEDKSEEDFSIITDKLEDATRKSSFFSALPNPVTRFVNALIYAVIILIGALLTIYNLGFSVGLLMTFLSFASKYATPFNDISSVITEIENALTCLKRVYELLDEEVEISDKGNENLEAVEGNISLNDVSFSYDVNQKLIEHLSLNVKKGQKIALVGPTGCGKTTFINLLMRFYDVNNGSISVDGHNIKAITRDSLRRNYGMVLQDTYLRYGTIEENITMGDNFTREQVVEAAKMSSCDHFISLLKDGYNTLIDENGGDFSQGQKQLIAICRVMLRLPPMLILDEATSSIDTRTEIKIQQAFNILMKNKTSFIVAHRLSTIKDADIILVMKDGNVIESGTHQDLLKKKGFYYELYNSQFVNENN